MDTKRLERVPVKYRKQVRQRLTELSKTIQARRESLGLTQEELAEQLDISVITLQFIEQRRRYPSLPMLFYICSFLNLELQLK